MQPPSLIRSPSPPPLLRQTRPFQYSLKTALTRRLPVQPQITARESCAVPNVGAPPLTVLSRTPHSPPALQDCSAADATLPPSLLSHSAKIVRATCNQFVP